MSHVLTDICNILLKKVFRNSIMWQIPGTDVYQDLFGFILITLLVYEVSAGNDSTTHKLLFLLLSA